MFQRAPVVGVSSNIGVYAKAFDVPLPSVGGRRCASALTRYGTLAAILSLGTKPLLVNSSGALAFLEIRAGNGGSGVS